MATIITIGTQGDQWFPIDSKSTGVSRKHAILTIPDNQDDPWVLEDNHSKNGTFIRDENGQMIRISRTEITPMTFIQLGPADIQGCSFYATRCLASNQQTPDRYKKEFALIRKELSQFKTFEQKEKKMKDWRRKVNRWSWSFVFIISVIIDWYLRNHPSLWSNTTILRALRYIVRYIPIIIVAILTWRINGRGKLAEAQQRMAAARRCPNPKCNRDLGDTEIKLGQCSSCKATI